MDQAGLGECCTHAPSPGWTHHQGIPHTPLPTQTETGCTSHHLGMDVALSLSLGLAGADVLLPSLWPKSNIQSVCCLHSYILTALPPESCLQPIQAFWVPQLSCASCSLLFLLPAGAALATQPLVAFSRTTEATAFHSYTAAQGLHSSLNLTAG